MTTTTAGRFLLCVALPIAALSACGSCGGVSLDDMPTRAAIATCDKVYDCCTATELSANTTLGTDRTSCEQQQRSGLDGKRGLIEAEETKGRVRYRPDVLEDCLRDLGAKSCEAMKTNATATLPACDAYLEARVADGAACGMDESCVSGNCEGEAIGKDGVCQPLAAVDTSCATSPCAEGLYCEASTSLCKATKADGANCNLHAECTTGGCNGRNPDAGVPGACGLKGGVGTTCFVNSGCASAGGGGPVALLGLAALIVAASRRRRRA